MPYCVAFLRFLVVPIGGALIYFVAYLCPRKYYTKTENSILRRAVPDTIILELDQRSLSSPALYDAEDALEV